MVFVNVAKEKVAELIGNDLSTGELGTSSQTAVVTDTGLIAGDSDTIDTLEVTQVGRQLEIDFNLDSITGNGSTYQEYANFFTDGTMMNRVTFVPVIKSSSITLNVKTILKVN
jgi:hypothetical protein